MLINLRKEDLDFLVNQIYIYSLSDLKKQGARTKIILWQHLAHNQPVIFGLSKSEVRLGVDRFVFVSNWQMENYIYHFGIDRKKSVVIQNAVSPAFQNLFPEGKSILAHKKLLLAYTSAPFRGLESLLFLFPQIKKRFPA